MFKQADGSGTLTNPHALQRVAQYFNMAIAPRPLI
jgi:hypothetical protein